MRTLLTCLAIAGVIVAAAGAVYREGLIILLGFAAVIIPLVMFAQGLFPIAVAAHHDGTGIRSR